MGGYRWEIKRTSDHEPPPAAFPEGHGHDSTNVGDWFPFAYDRGCVVWRRRMLPVVEAPPEPVAPVLEVLDFPRSGG
jgi:hypothetical protein